MASAADKYPVTRALCMRSGLAAAACLGAAVVSFEPASEPAPLAAAIALDKQAADRWRERIGSAGYGKAVLGGDDVPVVTELARLDHIGAVAFLAAQFSGEECPREVGVLPAAPAEAHVTSHNLAATD